MKISQYISGSGTWGELTPETMNKIGLGGRETALVNLAEKWAQAGHEVLNFVPVTKPSKRSYPGGGTSNYIPLSLTRDYLINIGSNVVVSWEEPKIFGNKAIRDNIDLGVIEMQVANMYTTPELDATVDHYAVLSNWAGNFLCEQDPNIDPEKIVVFPNGVDMNRYNTNPKYGLEVKGGEYQFYYSSSPDRGLNHLLKMWPAIRKSLPKATLHVCYGIEHWADNIKWSHNIQAEMALEILEGISQPGVNYHGKIGQNELAKLQESCHLLLYPADTMQPTETGCITIVEAGAALAPVISTECDCITSEFGESAILTPLPLDYEQYVGEVISMTKDFEMYESFQLDGRQLAESRDWGLIANEWLKFFSEKIYGVN